MCTIRTQGCVCIYFSVRMCIFTLSKITVCPIHTGCISISLYLYLGCVIILYVCFTNAVFIICMFKRSYVCVCTYKNYCMSYTYRVYEYKLILILGVYLSLFVCFHIITCVRLLINIFAGILLVWVFITYMCLCVSDKYYYR